MLVQSVSGAFPRRLVCKDFAIALYVCEISVRRFVFSGRRHIGAETGDSAAPGNTDCQKDRLCWFFRFKEPEGAVGSLTGSCREPEGIIWEGVETIKGLYNHVFSFADDTDAADKSRENLRYPYHLQLKDGI
ncbi:hypothetical protein [uncultured Bacteroides sp.]|uniref:hypothetical protein n=1 Tax=uncultured Bacteroides sp. TaxID=162156 RepID=UPI0025F1F702|nr:hypothetical protein [uncultured Bacteroides sp.]